MTTVESIRNPDRLSGFDHVGLDRSKPAGTKRFHAQAYGGTNNKAGHAWQGPLRATAEEAAQDYCDYINGQATPASRALKSARHPRAEKRPLTAAQQVALDILRDARAKPDAMGVVYLVSEVGNGFMEAVKVGWTSKTPPESRMGDYQAGNPRKLVMLGTLPGTKADEAALHQRFIEHNILGEWFRPAPELLSEFGIGSKEAIAA